MNDAETLAKTPPPAYKTLICMLIILFLAVAIGLGIAVGVIYGGSAASDMNPSAGPSTNEPGTRPEHVYRNAAVAADAPQCSEIGKQMLEKGGSAMDAAIAGLLCVGVLSCQSSGIGGGSFIMYYDRATETPTFLNSREVAPLASDNNLYVNESDDASLFGGLAIGVPGEIKGFYEAHQRFGRLSWGELFEPAIELAENGFEVGPFLAFAIEYHRDQILNDSSLREILVDGDGNLLRENSTMYRPQLAQTLRTIANESASSFYSGSLSQTIVDEIQARGGIITLEDLAQYEVAVKEPLSIEINGYTAYSGPPPCSGAVYALILNTLEGYNFNANSRDTVADETLTYHRIIEAFKFAFAQRSALGDEDFVNVTELVANMTSQDYADYVRSRIWDNQTHDTEYYEPAFEIVQDSGTSHIAIVDQYGNAASITTTINTFFGSLVRGPNTGIIYNNEMDDFATPGPANFFGVPPSPSNFIEPGKRPQSSMTPVIMVDDDGDVKLVVGGAGGTRITTATSLITMEILWFASRLQEAGERKRIHHQLLPANAFYELGFNQDVLDGLVARGHEVQDVLISSAIHAVNRLDDDWLEAYSDGRRDGVPAGF